MLLFLFFFFAATCSCLFADVATKCDESGGIESSSLSSKEGLVRHVLLIRHGDKMSKYPPCGAANSKGVENMLCYNEALFGNNPELSACGRAQARLVADRVSQSWNVAQIVSSPFMRTLQTALPLAKMSSMSIQVDPLFSEDRQLSGPFRERNAEASHDAASDASAIAELWNTSFSSPPIPTPEGNEEYWTRVDAASNALLSRVREAVPSSAVALFSHAGPSFSFAFGLCGNDLFLGSLEEFVSSYVMASEGLAPAGIIRATLDVKSGACISLSPPDNTVWKFAGCGKTKPHKKSYDVDPGKYYRPDAGTAAAEQIVDRSGD